MSPAGSAWRRLARRPDVALAASCAGPSDRVRVVGGVVRDAFLGRSGGDLDLSVASARADSFAARLAARAGSRVVGVGVPPRRILKVPFQGREIDVWEEEDGEEADLLRRDFTVNAVSFTLPEGRFGAAPGALLDLEKKRLAPPRPGVFLEDPLRVLRAARFLAQLPGFRVAPEALPEMKGSREIASNGGCGEAARRDGQAARRARRGPHEGASLPRACRRPAIPPSKRRAANAARDLPGPKARVFGPPRRPGPAPLTARSEENQRACLEGGRAAGRNRGWRAAFCALPLRRKGRGAPDAARRRGAAPASLHPSKKNPPRT